MPFCDMPPADVVSSAITAIGVFAPVTARSRLYASPAWPDPSDPDFVNAVIAVEWPGEPARLLESLHRVEAAFGRVRSKKNAPRTLDLDLLAFGEEISAEAPVLPHPRLESRDFVLAPLCDIAPDWRSPASGRSAREMLDALEKCAARPISG